jgi:hypothetical protein
LLWQTLPPLHWLESTHCAAVPLLFWQPRHAFNDETTANKLSARAKVFITLGTRSRLPEV